MNTSPNQVFSSNEHTIQHIHAMSLSTVRQVAVPSRRLFLLAEMSSIPYKSIQSSHHHFVWIVNFSLNRFSLSKYQKLYTFNSFFLFVFLQLLAK